MIGILKGDIVIKNYDIYIFLIRVLIGKFLCIYIYFLIFIFILIKEIF